MNLTKWLAPDVKSVINGLGPLAHHLERKRILLSGARGYLGKFIVGTIAELNKTLATPCKMVGLDSLLINPNDPREEWREIPNLVFMKHDVRHDLGNSPLVYGDGDSKFDYVLHMAGIASPYWYQKLPLETISVAVDGSRNLLEVAKAHGAKYMFFSSSEVYQTANVVPTPESYVGAIPSLTKRSSYDVSKLLGETLSYVYADQGVHTNIVRLFNSFGIGLGENDRRILSRIASAIKRRSGFTVYGHHGRLPTRTYTPVANTVLGIFLVLLKGVKGEVYNVGVDSPEISVPDLCMKIEQATGLRARYKFEPPPSNYETEPMRRCPNIQKLKDLGFLPVVDLDEGLRRFFEWAEETYTGTPPEAV